jgi:hypothetical protein
MHWQDRNQGLVRIVARLSAGMALGLVPAVLYGGLVAAVHLAVSGRWDRAPTFALGCAIAGALLGLLGGVAWALAGNPAPVSRPAAKPLLARRRIQRVIPGRSRTPAARCGRRDLQWDGSGRSPRWR